MNTAYKTIGLVLGCKPFLLKKITTSITDPTLSGGEADFALSAMQAYTIVDENKPGRWLHLNHKALALQVDTQKRLEFWQWWLLEALPHAWQSS